MYKKILVPLDGSKRAETILQHVEELALKYQAEVFLLQVVEPQIVYASPHGFPIVNIEELSYEAQEKEAVAYLSGLEAKLRKKNIEAKSVIEYGQVAHSIIKVARREEIDLIAMASHGRTGLSHVFYGSVAASVLHLIDRPLLLVRA
ncbi:MAG: universal stress protein [Anaerolineales bacterium]|nr:universal stress protein [Anaerolineales bacterium]